jgi:hypothetical protein
VRAVYSEPLGIVFIDGFALSVLPDVMMELGLRDRQRITEAQMWAVIESNHRSTERLVEQRRRPN